MLIFTSAIKIYNKRTRGERYTIVNFSFNSFSNANVLDMPVTAVIFIINKCIANFHNVLICLSNLMLNGSWHKFCWIKEVVGL